MKYFKILILFILFHSASAQYFIIHGKVSDSRTNEPLVLANVYIPGTSVGTSTNEKGEFKIYLSQKYKILKITYLGYEDEEIKLNWQADSIWLDIKLNEKPLQMSGIVVEGESEDKIPVASFKTLSQHNLKNIPPVGEPDILFSVSAMPSVNRTGDWKSSLSFEGTAPYQSGIYINDSRIYNPFHFFGILGSINPEFFKETNIYTSCAPVHFTNISSGVVDLKDAPFPSVNKTRGNISLLFSSLYYQSHFKNHGIQIGLRKTYFDIISRFVHLIPYGNVDANVKYHWIVNNDVYVKIFFDHSNDFFIDNPEHLYNSETRGNFLENLFRGEYNFGYSNFGLNLKYKALKGTWNFHFNSLYDYVNFKELIRNNFKEHNVTLQYHFNLSGYSKINTGVQLQFNKFKYYWLPATGDFLDLFPAAVSQMDSSNQQTFLQTFTQIQFFLKNIDIIAGFSLSKVAKNIDLNGMFGFEYTTNERMKLSVQGGAYSQYLASPHVQQELTIKSPIYIMNKAARNYQLGLGIDYNLNTAKKVETRFYFNFSKNLPYWAELRHKTMTEFKAKSYGMSVFFTDTQGILTYQMFYEWNKGIGSFDHQWFTLDWNISHTFKGIWGLKIQNDWFLNMAFTWRTGLPYTPVIGIYNGIFEDEDILDFGHRLVYGEKNSKRFPAYARLDLSLRKLFIKKGFNYLLYIQAINVLNRKNIMRVNWNDYLLFYKNNPNSNKDAIIRGFPIIPSIGIEFHFK